MDDGRGRTLVATRIARDDARAAPGGDNRSQTCDLQLFRPMLCQLSYIPVNLTTALSSFVVRRLEAAAHYPLVKQW